MDIRTEEQLHNDYAMYCEAKLDIDEEPLDFDQWKEFEASADWS